MMDQEKLRRLLQDYFDDTISETECIELLDYLKNTEPDSIAKIVDEDMLTLYKGPEFSGFLKRQVFQHIKSDPRFTTEAPASEDAEPKIIRFYQRQWLKVAVVFVIASVCSVLYFKGHKNSVMAPVAVKTQVGKPITPGRDKATLTLSNGKVIVLDTGSNGLIANDGKVNVYKSNKGRLVYNTLTAKGSQNIPSSGPVYNVLSTPRGGEFQVVLPDGTKVWLNSASSLKYPSEFIGNERRVSLTGEAYFEVAKNKEKPFFVSVNNVEVKVLGTHFNIAAYMDDNDVTTTLLEGSVQIKKSNNLSVISPGQQAIVNNNTEAIKVRQADIGKVMAWKNGYFIFYDEDLISIMKKVSRWYDVEVEYKGKFNNMRFGGTFYRFKSINELLSHMEQIDNIHFKIEGRRIIVMQ